MQKDEEQLNLLAIFYYILAGIMGLFACFPGMYIAFGTFVLVAPEQFQGAGQEPIPEFVGILMIVIGSFFMLLGWIMAGCIFYTGRLLSRRSSWQYCMVMSAVTCVLYPLGTILGIFSIIVLNRNTVRELFDASQPNP